MTILLFADKSESALQKKVGKSFMERGIVSENLILPPRIRKTETMYYFLVKTTL